MKIIYCKDRSLNDESTRRDYSYRITETERASNGEVCFGIEIERRDFSQGELVKVVRDGEKLISHDYDKVQAIMEKAYDHIVSPIHFIEIFGEDIDGLRFEM